MASRRAGTKEHVIHHKDGSLWAKGQMLGGVATGYWEWFRKDGSKMRSGYFEDGQQTGEWTTYDAKGRVYKVTMIKAKAGSKLKAEGKVSAGGRARKAKSAAKTR